MKMIVLIFLQSVKSIYALAGVGILVLTIFIPVKNPEEFISFLLGLSLIAVLCGPAFLWWRLQRGAARVLLSLPLGAGEAARACWYFAVGIPALWLLLLGVLCSIFQALFRVAPGIPLWGAGYVAAWALFYTGTVFLLLTFLPSGPADARGWKGTTASALYGVSLGASAVAGRSMLGENGIPGLEQYLVIGAGAILTYFGWLRKEALLGQLVTRTNAARRPLRWSVPGGKSRKEATGVLLLLQMILRTTGQTVLVGGVVVAITSSVLDTELRTTAPAIFLLVLIPAQWLSNARHFRTLPLTTGQLVRLLGSLFWIPSLSLVLVMIGAEFYWYNGVPWFAIKCSTILLALAALLPGALLRVRSPGGAMGVTVTYTLGVFSLTGLVGFLSIHIWLIFLLLAFPVGIILLHGAVARGSAAYRPHAIAHPGAA